MSFSVLIPCHNDGEYLHRSISSVATQLGADDEVIVIDDGSHPPAQPVVAELQVKFPEVEIGCITQPQSGVSAARNRGIDASKGAFLIMLDADDELLPGAVDAYRAHIERSSPGWMIATHEWQVGEERTTRRPDIGHPQATLFERFVGKRLHIGNLSCMCIRADLAARIRFAEHLRVGEDVVFLSVLMALSAPGLVSKPCARVHRRAEGSLRSVSTIEDSEQSQVFDTLFAHSELPDSYQSHKVVAEVRHCRSLLRLAWKNKRADVFERWYPRLVDAQPRARYDLKLQTRRLLLKARA